MGSELAGWHVARLRNGSARLWLLVDVTCFGLEEATWKELRLFTDLEFLRTGERADELEGPRLRRISRGTMYFDVKSSCYRKNGKIYSVMIRFDEWETIGTDPDLSWIEKARLLFWVGNIRVHCTCPAFLYWGFQYILTVLDSAIFPEHRRPVIRNPMERGVACKHATRVLRSLPFYTGDIAAALRREFAGETPSREVAARRARLKPYPKAVV